MNKSKVGGIVKKTSNNKMEKEKAKEKEDDMANLYTSSGYNPILLLTKALRDSSNHTEVIRKGLFNKEILSLYDNNKNIHDKTLYKTLEHQKESQKKIEEFIEGTFLEVVKRLISIGADINSKVKQILTLR